MCLLPPYLRESQWRSRKTSSQLVYLFMDIKIEEPPSVHVNKLTLCTLDVNKLIQKTEHYIMICDTVSQLV